MGLGLGLLVTPVMTAAMNAVPTAKAGMASSMLSLTQQVAGSVGIAILASILGQRATYHVSVVGESLTSTRPALVGAVHALARRAVELGIPPGDATRAAGGMVVRNVAQAATVQAFNDSFLVGAAIVLSAVIPALFLSPKGMRRAPAQPQGVSAKQ